MIRTKPLRARLLPDLMALGLALACMGYWAFDNTTHEGMGAAFLALAGRHVILNRRWFGSIRRGRYDAARWIRLVLNLMLAGAMLVLLATSLMISEALRGLLNLSGIFTLREVHWVSAYWLVVIIGLHIGLHWHIVMGLMRARLPVLRSRLLGAALWAVAILVAAFGVNSSFAMGLGTRLGFDYGLIMWDFNDSTLPYFAHWLAITVLYAVIAHAAVRLLALRRRALPHFQKETTHDK